MSVTDSDIAAIKSISNDNRSNLATMINATNPFAIFNVNSKNSQEIICPHCGNGSGDSHTGVKPKFENGVWLYHCFKCNEFSGDLLKIIATANNLDIKTNFFENFKDTHDFNYIKEKPHVGSKEPFGIEFITAETNTIIIVEGEIDSMSIDQACNDNSISAISTLGAAVAKNIRNKIFETLDNIFNDDKKPYILILFDNDKAGKINSKKFCEDFMEQGYPAVADFLSDGDEKVDANSIFKPTR